MTKTTRTEMRKRIKNQRQQLTASEQFHAQQRITRHVIASRLLLKSQHIAFYLPVGKEVDVLPLLQLAWRMGKKCYLPTLHRLKQGLLWFVPFYPGDRLVLNRYGILEPAHCHHRLKAIWVLDLVFTPLVAFDSHGHRLGMGAGFYDRTFSFVKQSFIIHKPKLIGLAYEFQKLKFIQSEPWDVSLSGAFTEKTFYKF